jgi:hypothetical protein
MKQYLAAIEGWLRRRGIAIPRLYLLVVLGLLGGLLGVMFIPSCRELLATVILHDFFAVCALAIVTPLFLCDPVRGRSPLWSALHLVCLAAAGLLALFFLVCCDLLARDDRAFLFLLSSVLGVLVGRLYVVDMAIAFLASTLSRSSGGRRLLLSTYARMLKVDPARVGLAPPSLGPRLVLSIRERAMRILGLRRTRSRPLEEAFRHRADSWANRVDADPSFAAMQSYAELVDMEVKLHRVLLVAQGIDAQDVVAVWPANFIAHWSALAKAYQRQSFRARGKADEALLLSNFRTQALEPLLESAQAVMRIACPKDAAGEKPLNDALLAFKAGGRLLANAFRIEFDRSVQAQRRPGVSPKAKLAFMLAMQVAAETVPADFLAVYAGEKSGEKEWAQGGLPTSMLALYVAVASRQQLETGGLSPAQAGPVIARLLRHAAFAGFTVNDFPGAGWAAVMNSPDLQWDSFAKGLKPLVLADSEILKHESPGVGQISIANAFALCVMLATVVSFSVVSPAWLPRQKSFRDLFAPQARTQVKPSSIDLSSEGDRVAVATAGQGLVTIDTRNYSVRQFGVSQGLSSNNLSDVVALSGQAFALANEGPFSGRGVDFLAQSGARPIIGLAREDHSQLTSESPLGMVNLGRNAVFVFRKGLLYYDASRRVLVSMEMPPNTDELLGVCGSKGEKNEAWLLSMSAGKGVISKLKQGPNLGTPTCNEPLALEPGLNPAKIFHDGKSLWCVDRADSGVYLLKESKWKLRAGSPAKAKENGGLAAADRMAISRRSATAAGDVLWMVKSGTVFARSVPVDPLQAELPSPWQAVTQIEDGYLGEVHAFAVDDVGYLVIPYADKLQLLSCRGEDVVASKLVPMPAAGFRIRSIDVGSGEILIAGADESKSMVFLMDFAKLVGLREGTPSLAWPSPIQSSVFLDSAFRLDDVVGAVKLGALTYHFDSKGRWLKYDSALHGLVNSGQQVVPFSEQPELLGKMLGLRVRNVAPSGGGSSALLASNYGVHEVSLDGLGIRADAVRDLYVEPISLPSASTIPIGLSQAKTGPEVYFAEEKSTQPDSEIRKYAHIWRLENPLNLASKWVRQSVGTETQRVFADTIGRVRIDQTNGTLFFGAPVAINDANKLIVRDMQDDIWKLAGVEGRWTDIVNLAEGGTAIRERVFGKLDGEVLRISQLLPSEGVVSERSLWANSPSAPKGSLLNSSSVVPVVGRGFVFPTDEGFWAYQPTTRSWSRLMGHATGKVANYRTLSDAIRHSNGASVVAWWADDQFRLYGMSETKATSFGSVGVLSAGVAVEDAFVALNDGNALFRFNLSTGVAQKLFAPIKPDGGSIALSAIEQSELGVAFLPAGGGQVFTLDEVDQFKPTKGLAFSSIAYVGGRLVGLGGVKGDSQLTSVFSQNVMVGSGLQSLRSLGELAVAASSTGAIWAAGFSGGELFGKVIGSTQTSETPSTTAKIVSASSFAGQLFVSVDGGIHCRPDDPAPTEVPGFQRIGSGNVDWFRSVPTLGKTSPAGGLGCYTLGENVEFSLISAEPKGGFRISNRLDVPLQGPGAGPLSVYKQDSAGRLVPYDDSAGVFFGGATSLTKRAKVHPLDAGLLVLTRAAGSGIFYYNPDFGAERTVEVVQAVDGRRVACPFGLDADFIYVSDAFGELPFLRDGKVLGRVAKGHAQVEVLTESAQSPVIQTGWLKWIEGGKIMGASLEGGSALTSEEMPALSYSVAASVSGLLPSKVDDGFSVVVEGVLVDVDLKSDKFRKLGAADLILPQVGGVLVASRRTADTWVLADGTVALPNFLKELGPVHLAVSDKYTAVFDPLDGTGYLKVKAVPVSGDTGNKSFTAKVVPEVELLLGGEATLGYERRVFHVALGRAFAYDLDRGEWSQPTLPTGFVASSIRKHSGGQFYLVDDRTADAVMIQSSGNPIGDLLSAKAYGVSLNGAQVELRVDSSGRSVLYAGSRKLKAGIDDWKRNEVAVSATALVYSGTKSDCTLLAESPGSRQALLYTRRGGTLTHTVIELLGPLESQAITETPEGFILTDPAGFAQHIGVSAEGAVMGWVELVEPFFLVPGIAPDRAPAGWSKVAGKFYHESGYEEGNVVQLGAPLRMLEGRLLIPVRRVASMGDVEVLDYVSVECESGPTLSLIHPDFAKLGADDAIRFEGGYLQADFNGTKVPVLSRKVAADVPAPIDQARGVAIVGTKDLYQLDGQGGLWLRDLDTGRRQFVQKVSAEAFFAYGRKGAGEALAVVLESSGKRFHVQSATGVSSLAGADWQFAASADKFSQRIGNLDATSGPKGFGFVLSGRFPLSITTEGWRVDGATSAPALQVTREGALMLEFSSGDSASKPIMHLPASGSRRFMQATLFEPANFSKPPKLSMVRCGGYTFDSTKGDLVVSFEGISRPLAFLPNGGVEVDHYGRAIAIAGADYPYLVNVAASSGRVFVRSWKPSGLGPLREVDMGQVAASANLTVCVDGDGFLKCGAVWYQLAVDDVRAIATRLDRSPVASWGEFGRQPGRTWAMEGGKVFAADGANWEEVPHRTSPLALAFDQVSSSLSDYRALPGGVVVYKSSMADGPRQRWYSVRMSGGLPRRFEATLPEEFQPIDTLSRRDTLGNETVFSRKNLTGYLLRIKPSEELTIPLVIRGGVRLPHLGEFANPQTRGKDVFVEAGKTAAQSQLYIRVPSEVAPPVIALALPPTGSSAPLPIGSVWWLKADKVSLEWNPTSGLMLSVRQVDGSMARALLGNYFGGEALEVDRPSRVILRKVGAESFAFSTKLAPEVEIVLPAVGCESLANVLSVRNLLPSLPPSDIFAVTVPFSPREMKPVNRTTGDLLLDEFSYELLAGPRILVRPGLELPLHKVSQLDGWTLPQGDVVSALRLRDGTLILQSKGGSWLSCYSAAGQILAGAFINPKADARLCWGGAERSVPALGSSAGAIALSVPDLVGGVPVATEDAVAVDGGLEVNRRPGKPCMFDLGGITIDPARYPSVDISDVSLAGDVVTLQDSYGLRNLVAGAYSKVTQGTLVRRSLGAAAPPDALVVEALCGAWRVVRKEGKYDVRIGQRSLLDPQGVPFVDAISDIDGLDDYLMFAHGERVVVTQSSAVIATIPWGTGEGKVSRAMARPPRLAISSRTERRMIDYGQETDVMFDVHARALWSQEACRKPLGYLPAVNAEFCLNEQRAFEMRIVLDKVHLGPPLMSYVGKGIFSGSQLATDRVVTLTSRDGVLFGAHALPQGEDLVWQERLTLGAGRFESPLRPRSGPNQSVEVPASLVHPWSERRVWRVDAEGMRWTEAGARWGY